MAVQIFKTKQLAVDLDANRQKRIEEMIKCSLVILGCREDEHCRCPHDLFSSSSGGGASGPSRGVPCSYGWRSLQLQQPPWEASDPSGRPEPDTVGWLRTACAGRGRGRDRRAETAAEGRCHGDPDNALRVAPTAGHLRSARRGRRSNWWGGDVPATRGLSRWTPPGPGERAGLVRLVLLPAIRRHLIG